MASVEQQARLDTDRADNAESGIEVRITAVERPQLMPMLLGEAAYAAFVLNVAGGRDLRGDELPEFNELGDDVRQAWVHAATASLGITAADLRLRG